jgi:hypothetical protein
MRKVEKMRAALPALEIREGVRIFQQALKKIPGMF